MYILSIFIKNREAAIPLYFNDKEEAVVAQKKLTTPTTHHYDVTDDSGHNLSVPHDQIAAALVQDWKLFLEAQSDYSVAQMEAKSKFEAKIGNPQNFIRPTPAVRM